MVLLLVHNTQMFTLHLFDCLVPVLISCFKPGRGFIPPPTVFLSPFFLFSFLNHALNLWPSQKKKCKNGLSIIEIHTKNVFYH